MEKLPFYWFGFGVQLRGTLNVNGSSTEALNIAAYVAQLGDLTKKAGLRTVLASPSMGMAAITCRASTLINAEAMGPAR